MSKEGSITTPSNSLYPELASYCKGQLPRITHRSSSSIMSWRTKVHKTSVRCVATSWKTSSICEYVVGLLSHSTTHLREKRGISSTTSVPYLYHALETLWLFEYNEDLTLQPQEIHCSLLAGNRHKNFKYMGTG